MVDEAFQRGFQRCLQLRDPHRKQSIYSERFEAALLNYFASYRLLNHPRMPAWWHDHTVARVAHAFNIFIPWCQEFCDLGEARVLEIGCGTGCSTVALASHAKFVLACDIHPESLEVARIRLAEDGFADRVKFLQTDPFLRGITEHEHDFEIVVLYGVLEHMLPIEKSQLLNVIWPRLVQEGKLIIYQTPNRLMPVDHHTTGLLGWGWIPPSWALEYGKYRKSLPEHLNLEEMYRLGYGVSYREIQKLLGTRRHRIDFKYIPESLYQRFFIRILMTCIDAPRWAFQKDFALVVTKN